MCANNEKCIFYHFYKGKRVIFCTYLEYRVEICKCRLVFSADTLSNELRTRK